MNLRHAQTVWSELVRPVLLVAAVIFPFRSAIADWNDVPTGSMRPTIIEGDRIFVNKLAYDLKLPFTTIQLARWDDPHRGDIVVLFSPEDGTRLVKRVVAGPGDVVTLRANTLVVNGVAAQYTPFGANREGLRASERLDDRAHLMQVDPGVPALRTFGPVTVPSGQYLVLGDNRDHSKDSRYFGFVPRERIVGRARAVVASFDPDRYYLPRGDRFLLSLD